MKKFSAKLPNSLYNKIDAHTGNNFSAKLRDILDLFFQEEVEEPVVIEEKVEEEVEEEAEESEEEEEEVEEEETESALEEKDMTEDEIKTAKKINEIVKRVPVQLQDVYRNNILMFRQEGKWLDKVPFAKIDFGTNEEVSDANKEKSSRLAKLGYLKLVMKAKVTYLENPLLTLKQRES